MFLTIKSNTLYYAGKILVFVYFAQMPQLLKYRKSRLCLIKKLNKLIKIRFLWEYTIFYIMSAKLDICNGAFTSNSISFICEMN